MSKKDVETVVSLVIKNTMLSKNDSKLLRYYAKCKENSTPPLSVVLQKTGIPDKKGWRRSRKKLEQLSLITYRNANGRDHFIWINWVTLCGLALLDEPLQIGGKAHSNFRTSPVKNALDCIAKRFHLTQTQYDETANILSLLKLEDAKRIEQYYKKQIQEETI